MRRKYVFAKKVYISILTSAVIMITMIATTFAWVGVLTESTFEPVEINVFNSELEEYKIEISTDGINFSDTLSFSDIRDQIYSNFGEEKTYSFSNVLNQDQCTTSPVMNGNVIKSLGTFTDIAGNETTKYYKFDLYFSCSKAYDTGMSSDYKLDVYLMDDLLSGSIKNKILDNSYTFRSDYVNPYDSLITSGSYSLPKGVTTVQAGTKIKSARVNSASACRVAFEKYQVVTRGDVSSYEGAEPVSAVIYQDSYEYPVYDSENDVYSFGAILPNRDNLAVGYYNSTEWMYSKEGIMSIEVPESISKTRGVNGVCPDKVLSSETNHLIDSSNSDEQIGTTQMMKVTCYFWFEGWDSDCFNAINASPVNINFGFSISNDEEF